MDVDSAEFGRSNVKYFMQTLTTVSLLRTQYQLPTYPTALVKKFEYMGVGGVLYSKVNQVK